MLNLEKQSFVTHLCLRRVALHGVVQGSSVQLTQEKLLRQHGILWRHLNIEMVRTPCWICSASLSSSAGMEPGLRLALPLLSCVGVNSASWSTPHRDFCTLRLL